METDESLIAAYRDGDDKAFSLLLHNYLPTIYNFVYRFTRTPAEAADITQETFIKVWQYLHRYKTGANFKAWIFRIARNTAIDYFRKRKALVFSDFDYEGGNVVVDTIVDVDSTPDEKAIQQETSERIDEALQQISLSQREVVILHAQEGMTFDEIGQIVDRPLNTVKSQYRRGVQTLRMLLEGENI